MACRYQKDRLVKGPKINQYVETLWRYLFFQWILGTPDLLVSYISYIFGTFGSQASQYMSGNDRHLVPNIWGTGRCGAEIQNSKKSPTGPTERTPKPENLIALATSLGVRW